MVKQPSFGEMVWCGFFALVAVFMCGRLVGTDFAVARFILAILAVLAVAKCITELAKLHITPNSFEAGEYRIAHITLDAANRAVGLLVGPLDGEYYFCKFPLTLFSDQLPSNFPASNFATKLTVLADAGSDGIRYRLE